jgi:hypothetical protein
MQMSQMAFENQCRRVEKKPVLEQGLPRKRGLRIFGVVQRHKSETRRSQIGTGRLRAAQKVRLRGDDATLLRTKSGR